MGYGLWTSDGTAAGIVRLTPRGVIVQSTPVTVWTRAVFFAQDAEHGTELWVSEGMRASTRLLVDLVPGPDSACVSDPSLLRGQLAFQFSPSCDTSQVWLTDGTAEGTRRLIDVDPLLAPLERSETLTLAEVGGKLFFLGKAETGGELDLWVSPLFQRFSTAERSGAVGDGGEVEGIRAAPPAARTAPAAARAGRTG